jgi:cytochrome c-type biogenesis protein CcsB
MTSFVIYLSQADRRCRKIGLGLLIGSLVVQVAAIGTLAYNVRTIEHVTPHIAEAEYEPFAVWMLQEEGMPREQIAAIPPAQLVQMSSNWVEVNGPELRLSLNANPVEFAALITAFTVLLFVLLFSIDTARVRNALPAAKKLDGLMYRLGGIAFAGLALLLITGAIWANESWGRYWGWDAKETGALVAWLTYAGFLHSRIAYGWRGRRSAYFAVAAFLFVIFTYLGVSYLLPGLHSYA